MPPLIRGISVQSNTYRKGCVLLMKSRGSYKRVYHACFIFYLARRKRPKCNHMTCIQHQYSHLYQFLHTMCISRHLGILKWQIRASNTRWRSYKDIRWMTGCLHVFTVAAKKIYVTYSWHSFSSMSATDFVFCFTLKATTHVTSTQRHLHYP